MMSMLCVHDPVIQHPSNIHGDSTCAGILSGCQADFGERKQRELKQPSVAATSSASLRELLGRLSESSDHPTSVCEFYLQQHPPSQNKLAHAKSAKYDLAYWSSWYSKRSPLLRYLPASTASPAVPSHPAGHPFLPLLCLCCTTVPIPRP